VEIDLEYLIAVVMGYFVGTNAIVHKRAKSSIGAEYANPILRLLSELGGLGGWFCILPAAYFVGSGYGNGFMQGLLFCATALGGALLAGLAQMPGLNYLISASTLFVNAGLAALVYTLTRN
jgi:hypothetical protein